MSQVYDNWERLVAAVIRKQQLWKLFHDQSRSPSICSESSESSSSINFEELEVNLSFAAKKEDDGESSLAAAFAEIFTFRELTIGKELEVNPSFDAEKKDDGKSSPAVTKMFTFRELANATKNFRADCILHEGGFGRVYKGQLESTKQIVSIKQFDRDGLQGNREFLVEVLMLSLLHHPNMVNLIGHCADSDQRFAVYEYMPPLGYLGDHLHDLPPDKEPLPWNARMKIAAGVAKCLEYLHEKVNPPVIHRNLKCSNILLGEGYHPKLSDFGLAKLGPVGGKSHVSTRVMGTYGYCAPEYAMTGRLTVKADVYSFGVVLLEIITGGKAIDNSRAAGEHNLVAWARPLFKDQSRFLQMADPLLQGRYPTRGFVQALAVAAMCLQEQPDMRPSMSQVATATSYLALQGHHLIDTSSKGPADPSIPIM